MTRRPGRIKEEIAVPFPKPRSFDLVTTPTFVTIKERVLHLIREELTSVSSRASIPGRIPS
jgi:ABC-type nitrate/sulfonate/bicarbonate transport system ATPase subunit